ncbi:hypothetical protein BGZ96_011060 [Linnemannia gamsii]|uniref:FAD-binding domain-containing protein n=1 Tax=Linnemannia gamsii TaxID=64522 RepID=A0ABQ7JT83_9FUNG|nr:hypothetical protein BGZ96_011060 [Linnemannia gamsii]
METAAKPRVLIVGAGLGGLALGILLERAQIPFEIFERTSTIKPLGSALSVGPNLIPFLEQIMPIEDFFNASKPMTDVRSFDEQRQFVFSSDFSPIEELTGYKQHIISRPVLYDLLLRQIPAHKVHLNKRVLDIGENDKDDKVFLRTSDNGYYEGDILIGADGAYSAVRQRLYESLKQKGQISKADLGDLPFKCTCLVGQTDELDVEEFPQLKEPICQFWSTLGEDRPFSWVTFTTPQGKICWMVIQHLSREQSKAAEGERFRGMDNSEWGPIAAQSMCDATRRFPIPGGNGTLTMGDLYDRTPKNLISKVMLEEKVFETWHSGRVALLGDACHKLNPSAGQGAVTAIHDAIALANLIYSLESTSRSAIHRIFTLYKAERYPIVQEAFKSSEFLSKRIERSLTGLLARWMSRYTPLWLWKIMLAKSVKHRPTASFLPPVEVRGSVRPEVQLSGILAEEAFRRRQQYQQQHQSEQSAQSI